jgi:hypothetical protein
MSTRTRVDDELDKLRTQFPGWEFGFVQRTGLWPIWCSRPLGCTDTSQALSADTPEHLAEYVAEAETGDESCTEDRSNGYDSTVGPAPLPVWVSAQGRATA